MSNEELLRILEVPDEGEPLPDLNERDQAVREFLFEHRLKVIGPGGHLMTDVSLAQLVMLNWIEDLEPFTLSFHFPASAESPSTLQPPPA